MKHDLNPDDLGGTIQPETTLRRLQSSIAMVSLEESLEIARAEAARASAELQEQSKAIGSNFSEAIVRTMFHIALCWDPLKNKK